MCSSDLQVFSYVRQLLHAPPAIAPLKVRIHRRSRLHLFLLVVGDVLLVDLIPLCVGEDPVLLLVEDLRETTRLRFEDEREYIGRAIDDDRYTDQRSSTRVAGHPVILSVLFDGDGTLRGLRVVSDPRASPLERRMAHMLRLAVINRYGAGGWNCTDLSAADGETPVGGVFVKQRCEKQTPERALNIEARFLRKPGQNAIDPATGEYTQGQFESWTRFEVFDPAARK